MSRQENLSVMVQAYKILFKLGLKVLSRIYSEDSMTLTA